MTLSKTRTLITVLLWFTLASSGYAQAPTPDPAEQDELAEFLQLLEQQTSLATNTRINADYVPGMLSVLNAEQLQRRGYRTVWEALASLPGVQANMNETGMRSVTVRGVGELFEPGKVKLLLNGKALNASASATTGTLYDTPITQVDRIEFIRGPGSAVHGEFAYAGVLNVITRKHDEAYSVSVGSDNDIGFSGLLGFGEADDEVRVSLNFAARQTDGENIDSGADRSPPTIPTYASGPINNKRDFFSAILDIDGGTLDAILQFQQGNRGDHFGTNNLLPPKRKQTVISDTVFSAGLTRAFDIDENLKGEWSLNALHNSTEQNGLFLGVPQVFGGLGNEGDVIADSLLEERRFEARASLQYDVAEHQLFAEILLVEIEVTASEQFINLDPNTMLPSPTLNEFPGPVSQSAERSSVSLVLQDEFRIDDRLTLTSGLRFDDYQDFGSNLSPRIALVWRQSDEHIFKAQLARAFRPPSLIEVGGAISASIDPEINDTFEFGHIYHGNDRVMRNTIYFSRLDKTIWFQDVAPIGYLNAAAQELIGYELEFEQQIDERWDLIGNLSLQDYTNEGLPGAVPWMLKFGVGYEFEPLTELYLQINSIGSRDRGAGDPRGDFAQTTQVDLTLHRGINAGLEGYTYSLGIQNLFDERLKHPAPTGTYPNDYPYSDGATLWFQIRYQP